MYKVTIVQGFTNRIEFKFIDIEEVKDFMEKCFMYSTEMIEITVEYEVPFD